MAEMGQYCKAYLVRDFRGYDGWTENTSNLVAVDGEDADEPTLRTELVDEDVLYLQENFVVTDGIFMDEHVVFDDVTERWKAFCLETLDFEVPSYATLEVPATAGDEANG